MVDQSETSALRQPRNDRDATERTHSPVRREMEHHGLRQAEEPADSVNPQGVIWRWHRRRRRERS